MHTISSYAFLLLLYSVRTCVYSQDENDPTLLGSFRRVAFVEDFFDILHRVHAQEKGHLGYKKTLASVCL